MGNTNDDETSGRSSQRREPPWPLRIPKQWYVEIQEAADKRGISKHAYLLKAIRRVLDGEKSSKQSRQK